MDFEKRLEEVRAELISMSRKISKLKSENKSLKKLYRLEKTKSVPVKKAQRKRESKHQNRLMENIERFSMI